MEHPNEVKIYNVIMSIKLLIDTGLKKYVMSHRKV